MLNVEKKKTLAQSAIIGLDQLARQSTNARVWTERFEDEPDDVSEKIVAPSKFVDLATVGYWSEPYELVAGTLGTAVGQMQGSAGTVYYPAAMNFYNSQQMGYPFGSSLFDPTRFTASHNAGTALRYPLVLAKRFKQFDGDVLPTLAPGSQSDGRRQRVKAHFRTLRRLPKNYDNEGASAPDPQSVDSAIAFTDAIDTSLPFYATLNDDGLAVIEFEDRASGLFADITFHAEDHVEFYARIPGSPSRYVEGRIQSSEFRSAVVAVLGMVM